MLISENVVGRKVIVQITEKHVPEVWKIWDIREGYFGRFVAFRTIDNMEIVVKPDTLYSIKFV